MVLPTWIKPVLCGVVIGGIAATVLGFSTGGWITASKAEVVANEQANAEVAAALLPICVELASQDTQRSTKIEGIRSKPSYQRNEAIMDAGWTTMPGTEKSDRRVASVCVEKLLN
ncbi:MAG: hypothetical protein P1U88_13030 [Thalassobaculaceae bacterium]|nr:hypothetical protein [Thalassobaculaceae bacterium]